MSLVTISEGFEVAIPQDAVDVLGLMPNQELRVNLLDGVLQLFPLGNNEIDSHKALAGKTARGDDDGAEHC